MCGKNRFRNLALLSAGTLAGTLAGTEAASAEGRNGSEAPKKPNILFFLVDDLGWSDIGCFSAAGSMKRPISTGWPRRECVLRTPMRPATSLRRRGRAS